MGETRKTRREREAPVFRGGWKNICIHPRPSLPSPISARFLDIGSGVSIFRSFASRSDFRTEPLLFPPCIQSPIPFPLFPLPCPLSLLVRQFPYPPLPPSLSLSFFPLLLPRGRSSSRSFLLVGAMCIRKYESFVALSTTAFLELSAIVRE